MAKIAGGLGHPLATPLVFDNELCVYRPKPVDTNKNLRRQYSVSAEVRTGEGRGSHYRRWSTRKHCPCSTTLRQCTSGRQLVDCATGVWLDCAHGACLLDLNLL